MQDRRWVSHRASPEGGVSGRLPFRLYERFPGHPLLSCLASTCITGHQCRHPQRGCLQAGVDACGSNITVQWDRLPVNHTMLHVSNVHGCQQATNKYCAFHIVASGPSQRPCGTAQSGKSPMPKASTSARLAATHHYLNDVRRKLSYTYLASKWLLAGCPRGPREPAWCAVAFGYYYSSPLSFRCPGVNPLDCQ